MGDEPRVWDKIVDFWWWWKTQGPKYGWVGSFFTAAWNARHFKRDGSYRIHTSEKKH